MSFITRDEIKEKVPAVFGTKPAEILSDKYVFTPTTDIVDAFEKVGWLPTKVSGVRSRKSDPETNKHMIRFASTKGEYAVSKVGDLRPEIVIINSHNGSSPLIAELGTFRLVCGNGLIVADTSFSKMKWRHMKIDYATSRDLIIEAMSQFTVVFDKIGEYKKIILNKNQQTDFASKMINMVWKDGIFEPELLVTPKRVEDSDMSLFSTFNMIQENFTKGGIHYQLKDPEKGHKFASTRPVKNIERDFNTNVALWGMMETFRTENHF